MLISGSNRPGNKTVKVARIAESLLKQLGQEVFFVDLLSLPPSLYDPASYARKPPEFAPYQEAVFAAQGILSVIPEYNGSFPGAYKYFIDMLKFPESLADVPAAFIGLGSGEWGGLRPVEQAEMVFHYRHAHLYGHRLFINNIKRHLDASGGLHDPEIAGRLSRLVQGFVEFCRRVRPAVQGEKTS